MSQNLPKRSLRDFLSLCHPNHFILAGTNNRNVIITYTTNSSRPLLKQIEIFSSILTVYFNGTYFPYYMCELLECLLRISPSGQNPCGGNKCKLFREHCSLWGGGEGMVLLVFYKYGFFYWVWRFVIHLLIKPSEWPHQYWSSPHNYEFKFQPHPGLSSSRARWPLTFALGRRENLRFFKQIICWAPRILQVQSTRLPSIFLYKALTPTTRGFEILAKRHEGCVSVQGQSSETAVPFVFSF